MIGSVHRNTVSNKNTLSNQYSVNNDDDPPSDDSKSKNILDMVEENDSYADSNKR